jgi:methionyl-tRNA synthetase
MKGRGSDVFFMTGTDEHGEKIEKASIERGYKAGEEKRFVDEIVPVFKKLWARLGIKYDYFIRTTDGYHQDTVRAILDRLYRDGRIYKKAYNGWFCTPCETFWSQTDSPDGVCPDCKRPADKLDETNYFLKISEYQGWLVDHIKSNPLFIRPDFRRNEVLGFLNEPLLDLCISRPKSRMGWGIEIPFDKSFVTYVWFDALINYISGIGYPHDMKTFNRYWPCDFHVIGKDILRHHAVYWPIILKALDLPPPKAIFAHGWWVVKGEKMSKSKGNIVDPAEMIDKYGVEPYRYFLLREVAFGLDGVFSEDALVGRYNSDLANDLGNLLNRTLTMTEKYFEGNVPKVGRRGEELRKNAQLLDGEISRMIPDFEFSAALSRIWEVVGMANKFIEESKPWALAKEKKTEELASVIYSLLEVLRVTAVSISPFMPETAIRINRQLGLKEGRPLEEGIRINKLEPLFPRIDPSPS